MKQVYSYQEIGSSVDQGKQVLFTCSPEARVSAIQKQRESDTVTITLNLSIRDVCVGIVEYEYASIADVLEAFDIDDRAEIWEVLDRTAIKAVPMQRHEAWQQHQGMGNIRSVKRRKRGKSSIAASST